LSRLVEVDFYQLTTTERLEVLRLYNQQREKSPGERIKEKLLDIDPKDAHQELKRRRLDSILLKGATDANVKMGAAKKGHQSPPCSSWPSAIGHPGQQGILAVDSSPGSLPAAE